MNKTITTSAPSIKATFAESTDLQKDLEKLIESNTLSKEELTLLEEKMDGLIDALEKVKVSINR
jgi:hypothetical protein